MKSDREYPRYDIKVVTRGEGGFAAFLIGHDTGESWVFDVDLTWKGIRKSDAFAKVRKIKSRR